MVCASTKRKNRNSCRHYISRCWKCDWPAGSAIRGLDFLLFPLKHWPWISTKLERIEAAQAQGVAIRNQRAPASRDTLSRWTPSSATRQSLPRAAIWPSPSPDGPGSSVSRRPCASVACRSRPSRHAATRHPEADRPIGRLGWVGRPLYLLSGRNSQPHWPFHSSRVCCVRWSAGKNSGQEQLSFFLKKVFYEKND